jgi:hypothetical protein
VGIGWMIADFGFLMERERNRPFRHFNIQQSLIGNFFEALVPVLAVRN